MSWIALLRWEMAKIVRRRGSYVGPLLCIAFCAVLLISFGYSNFRALRRFSFGAIEDPMSHVNGYFFATFALYFGNKAILPLLAALVSGGQIAGEAKEGTLRLLLTRPPSRAVVFATKTLVSFLWVLLTVYFLVFFSLAVGLVARGGGDFLVFVWEFRQHGPWLADSGAWLPMFLLTGLGASLGLMVFVALGMALSTITDSPVVAHVGALGTFLISSVVERLPEQVVNPVVQRVLPTTHMSFWHELYWLFHDDPSRFDAHRFWSDIRWCTMYTVVFLAVGLVVFARKDVTS